MKKLPKVIEVQIARLIEDPNNPNHMGEEEFQALVQNIRTVGFLQPILVKEPDEEGNYPIVDGHHRSQAASKAGLSRVLAVVWDGTDEMRQALAIGMNKLRGALNLGEVSKIVAELSEAGWGTEELKITGYSEAEIDDLLKAAQPKDDDDVLKGATSNEPDGDSEEDEGSRTFTLELSFKSADDLQKAKRALKRAAGKGGELGDGLLVVLAERD